MARTSAAGSSRRWAISAHTPTEAADVSHDKEDVALTQDDAEASQRETVSV